MKQRSFNRFPKKLALKPVTPPVTKSELELQYDAWLAAGNKPKQCASPKRDEFKPFLRPTGGGTGARKGISKGMLARVG